MVTSKMVDEFLDKTKDGGPDEHHLNKEVLEALCKSEIFVKEFSVFISSKIVTNIMSGNIPNTLAAYGMLVEMGYSLRKMEEDQDKQPQEEVASAGTVN